MASKVVLEISEGALKGKENSIKPRDDGSVIMNDGQVVIDEHDVVVFGRERDCHIRLPEDDRRISRHQFILEANPPGVRVRDLGSLNGTHVRRGSRPRWEEIGRRRKGETPENGAKRRYADVDLQEGDAIKAGRTVIRIHVETIYTCDQCGAVIPDSERAASAWSEGRFLCRPCRQKMAAAARHDETRVCADCGRRIGEGHAQWGGRSGSGDDYCRSCWEVGHGAAVPARDRLHNEPLRCKKCGKDVEKEVGHAPRGDYLCAECQDKAAENPVELLYLMLKRAGLVDAGVAEPQIAGYEIIQLLGMGGFGAVYLAKRGADGCRVALKVMLSRVAVNEKVRRDFLREIETTRILSHPNVVTLLDHGSAGVGFYFVMEYYPAGNVADLMRRRGGYLSIAEAGPLMIQSLTGLAYMHAGGFVHRDLKPNNILLQEQDGRLVARISDLGLAKNFEQAGFSGYTITGQYAGAYEFMPREQLTHFKYAKPIHDLWSMGATFYNMLTGCLPRDFPRGRDQADIVLHEDMVPVRERDSSVPRQLADVIDKSISSDIHDRYQTAEEMKSAIEHAL